MLELKQGGFVGLFQKFEIPVYLGSVFEGASISDVIFFYFVIAVVFGTQNAVVQQDH